MTLGYRNFLAVAMIFIFAFPGCKETGKAGGKDSGGADGKIPDGAGDSGDAAAGDDGDAAAHADGDPAGAVSDENVSTADETRPAGDETSSPSDPVSYGPPYDDPDWLSAVGCRTEPPEGAILARPPPPYSGGECPELAAGTNTIVSGGKERQFMLALPSEPVAGEKYPVLFMWHWLKSSPESFYEHGEIQAAVDQQRFIGVIPASLYDIDLFGLIELPWPFVNFVSEERVDEEYLFFDDMLSCVSARFPVNKECVSTVGVSAGALFAVQLGAARSLHIASVLSLSGGAGVEGGVSNFVRRWTPPERAFPAIVLWGGPRDSCIMLNFQDCSQELERRLAEGGHFFVECVHNCRHAEPPVDPPAGKSRYYILWDFIFKHPFWLPAGLSPYSPNGLPADYIPWCGIGAGSAVPRAGDCPPPSCPL